MKFSIILVPQVPEGMPEPYERITEQICFAEEPGYDTVWLTEHHFSPYGRPSVPAIAGHALANTLPDPDQYGCRCSALPASVAGRGRLGNAGRNRLNGGP